MYLGGLERTSNLTQTQIIYIYTCIYIYIYIKQSLSPP